MPARRDDDSIHLRTIWAVISVVFVVIVSLSGAGVVIYNWVSDVNADRIVLKLRLDQIERKQADAEREERWNRNRKTR